MEAKKWVAKIKKACKDAGTYRQFFDEPIKTLGGILEQRDATLEQYIEEGSKPIIWKEMTNGAMVQVASPHLVLIDTLNKTALTYWRDLGLTPKGLKALDENALKEKKQDAFVSALNDLGL